MDKPQLEKSSATYLIYYNDDSSIQDKNTPFLISVSYEKRTHSNDNPYRIHSNQNMEILLIVKCENSNFLYGDTEYPLQSGDLIVVPEKQTHCEIFRGSFEYYAISLQNLPLNIDEKNFMHPTTKEESHLFMFYMQSLLNELQKKQSNYKSMVKNLFENFLTVFYRTSTISVSYRLAPPRFTFQYVTKIKNYLHLHYMETDINFKKLAEDNYISQQQLIKEFYKYTGYTPKQYLLLLKLRLACNDLLNRDNSITQISRHIGFKNLQTFIHSFKKYLKISPAKFRESYRSNPLQGEQIFNAIFHPTN